MLEKTLTPAAAAVTPVMRQYLGLKERHPADILFFRLGDFYEMFFEDAVKAAPLLEVALTKRQGIPMCGVPYHAATGYIAKLLKHGVGVAVAEQLEDPKKTKGMVKRGVVRVITPGTLVEDELLPSRANNFLVAVAVCPGATDEVGRWMLAAADVSTGRQWAGASQRDGRWSALKSTLAALNPSETLLIAEESRRLEELLTLGGVVRLVPAPVTEATGGDGVAAAPAVAAIRVFLEREHPEALRALAPPEPLPFASGGTMLLDETAIRHLELVSSADPGGGPTLFDVLDRSVTPMGSRLLRWWLLNPLAERAAIAARLDQVEALLGRADVREQLKGLLREVSDLERIRVRIVGGSASPRDVAGLRQSLARAAAVRDAVTPKSSHRPTAVSPAKAGVQVVNLPSREKLTTWVPAFAGTTILHPSGDDVSPEQGTLRDLSGDMDAAAGGELLFAPVFAEVSGSLTVPEELITILETQLAESPPARLADGGVMRDGFHPDLDELRTLRRSGKRWIAEMEAAERERTGISNLRVGYNDVFGYFLEVSRSHLAKVPPEWIRKQTLTGAERYITPSLKEQEEKLLGAEARIAEIEARLYAELLHQLAAFSPTIARAAAALAHVDAARALSEVAEENAYTRPRFVADDRIEIRGGRHPVVERHIGRDRFIANDLTLGGEGGRLHLITGPNMAGKSTYLRQTALIAIMAQMGSFVPAEAATLGLVDRIFTRIGASDRVAQGQSTFMVEMQEVSALLANATPRSLLILDEVGRGTSTFDGIAIAWAVVETLAGGAEGEGAATGRGSPAMGAPGPRTLFATHYFELTQLAERLPGVRNAHATAKEWPGPDGRRRVVFLYQIRPGPADRSYGIHVAEMAGLPPAAITRAREILRRLEGGDHTLRPSAPVPVSGAQLELFARHPVLDELAGIDVDTLTPLEALTRLAEMKARCSS